jgi:hypothetical protein
MKPVRITTWLGALLCIGLFTASPASAGYETVKHFAPLNIPAEAPEKDSEFPEDTQLGGVSGMAVNRTGAGEVPPGTFYAAGLASSSASNEGGRNESYVARFSPSGEFELSWNLQEEQCGPKTAATCLPAPGGPGGLDIDINQSTGNVYVFHQAAEKANEITVYDADGAQITEFAAVSKGTFATTPDKLHEAFGGKGAIAVDSSGAVYVFDFSVIEGKSRLAIFKPKVPGVYSDYQYAGELLNGVDPLPQRPVLDDAGNIYTAAEDSIQKFSSSGAKLCAFPFSKGGITSVTVNPVTEEVFFFTFKDARIHRLAPCTEGTMVEEVATPPFQPEPQRGAIEAMTVNPELAWGPGRPAGTLYAGAGENCPTAKACPAEAQGQSSQGYILARPPEIPPTVTSQSVTGVSATGATLRAQVNPGGSFTEYVFQYLTEAAYQEAGETFTGASEAPISAAALGTGQNPLPATATITGLQADTAYRFRVIATSHCSPPEPAKVCEDTGSTTAFHTFPLEAPGLPDHRAYELVSPAHKNGGQVIPPNPGFASCSNCKPGIGAARSATQLTPDGDGISYQSTPFTLNQGLTHYDEQVSRRTASGWNTIGIGPPQAGSGTGSLKDTFLAYALDPGLNRAIISTVNPSLTPEAPAGYANLYAEATADPLALTPLLTAAPPNRAGTSSDPFQIGAPIASADLSRVFFAANDALTAATLDAPAALDGGKEKFNLYEWADGQLRLVNVLPGNAAAAPGASFGSGSVLSNEVPKMDVFAGAVSSDGSRVFWSSETGQLYVREDAGITRAVPGSGPAARFLAAATDGSRVLLSDGALYDLETENAVDLTAGLGGFLGTLGHSDDLTHIYFAATAVLDPTPNQFGDAAQPGKANVYSWQAGSAAYVATLPTQESHYSTAREASITRRSAQASPGGRFLAFGSNAQPTGYDNIGPCGNDPENGGYLNLPCHEVFLYDSAAAVLRCISCNPAGEVPHGNSYLPTAWDAPPAQPQLPYITDSGRLYFDSADHLALADSNGNVEDVYEYQPEGLGTCERQGGCVSLVSAGREATDSNFLTADSTGKNVFFVTRDRLTLPDRDELLDLYDAREDGGPPAETEPPPSPCQGEACAAPYSPPSAPNLGSLGSRPSGNVHEAFGKPPCAKNKARRKGKCVPKQPRRGKHKHKSKSRRAGAGLGGVK